ncbi:MAG: T9SS type A sorting domain-containing protein [Bacteroidales bacterium]|nr:T9SS type A sorting domain-containing protein [Bacteroidales bacterium]
MKIKIIFIAIIYLSSLLGFSQSTFTKWISTEENEILWRMEKIDDDNYLVVIGRGYYTNHLEFFLNVENVFYKMNGNGQILDSLVTDKILDYEIILSNVIRIDQEGFLCAANALNTETLDEQLCLFRLDENLNITDYSFHGSADVNEVVTWFTINHEGDIVFTGINRSEEPLGETFLWKFDPEGNELEFKADSSYLTVGPTIIELAGNNKYYVFEHTWVAIYNQDFENDTILDLEISDIFFSLTRKHVIVDDFHHLLYGIILNAPGPNPWDMAVLLMDENYQIDAMNTYGTPDTNDAAYSISLITTDQFYLGGIKNNDILELEDSWLSLYKTNLSGDIFFSRFYGGYGYYFGVQTIATQDGGCLLAANYWDFYTWIPGEPENHDVFIMKVDENGLLTNIPKNIPFEQTDILVFPNPGKDYLKIESSLKNLSFQLFNVTGEVVLQKDFNSSVKLNTDNLPSGSYIYRITINEEIIKTGKWIKK